MKKNIIVFGNNLDTARKTMVGSVLHSYHDVHIELDQKERKVEVVVNSHPIQKYDLVYFRGTIDNYDMSIALASCINHIGIPLINTALLKTTSSSKSYQYSLYFQKNIPFPHTFLAYSDRMIKILPLLEKKLRYPFIMKAVGARQGKDNYLIKNSQHFQEIVSLYKSSTLFVAQEFIPNDFDYRILTTGYKAAIAYKRVRNQAADTHLNNVSQGGYREDVELSSIRSLTKLAEKASKVLFREVCGVDVVVDRITKKPYILEANAAPQLDYPPALKAVRAYLEGLE